LRRPGTTRPLGEVMLCRFQRGVNDDANPYSNHEEDQSAVEVFLLPENRAESMLAPESPGGIDQKIKGNRGRRDEDCDCRMESRDVPFKKGYGTRDEKGIDDGHLVVERVFHAFWSMEYEDS
jgi:hypothetical protein